MGSLAFTQRWMGGWGMRRGGQAGGYAWVRSGDMQKINDGDGLEVAGTRYRCQLPGPGWRGGQGTERQGSGAPDSGG